MSGRPVPWLVRASAALYRRLFVLYPPAFRRDCAAEMAQVFTDLAHEAHRRAGAVGVFALWGRALTDLVVTALAERSALMSNRTAQRLGGLCLMIGGAVGGLALIVRQMIGFAILFGVPGEVWLSVAALLFIPGIIALHLWLAGSGGGWRWLGTVLAVGGVLALALGQLAFALHLGGALTSCGAQCGAIAYPAGSVLDGRLYAVMRWYGTGVAVVGLGALSVLALVRRPLSRRAALPAALTAGYVAFMSLPGNAPAIFPGVELLLLWVGAAFLLGRALWTEAGSATGSLLPMTDAG
jgi:hypothetical protein